MTKETEDTMCENVIQTMINYMKNNKEVIKSELMERFDITSEQFNNCFVNAVDRHCNPKPEKKVVYQKLTTSPNPNFK